MKRMAIAVGALVLIVAVVLPPLFGMKARPQIETNLTAIGDSLSPIADVAFVFDEWDVGWYSSTATVTLKVEPSKSVLVALDTSEQLDFEATLPKLVTVRHGPVLIGSPSGLGWGGSEFVVDATVIPELENFTVATGVDHIARFGVLVGFLGGTKVDMDIPAFKLSEGEPPSLDIDFEGFVAKAAFGRSGERMSSNGEFAGVSMTSGAWLVAVDRSIWEFQSVKDARVPDMWLGDATTDIGAIRVTDGDAVFEMSNLHVIGDTTIEDNQIVARALYETDEATIMDIQLTELVAEIVAGISIDGFAILTEISTDPDSLDPAKQTEVVGELLKQRLRMNIERLGFKHEGRSAMVSMDVELRGDELPADFDFAVANDFMALAPVIYSNLDMSFHSLLVDGLGVDVVAAVVQALAQEGVLQLADQQYSINIRLEDGAATVNGKPLESYSILGMFQ